MSVDRCNLVQKRYLISDHFVLFVLQILQTLHTTCKKQLIFGLVHMRVSKSLWCVASQNLSSNCARFLSICQDNLTSHRKDVSSGKECDPQNFVKHLALVTHSCPAQQVTRTSSTLLFGEVGGRNTCCKLVHLFNVSMCWSKALKKRIWWCQTIDCESSSHSK